MITHEFVRGIIDEVSAAVKGSRTLANRLGINKREINIFEGVFDSNIIQ